MSEEQIWKVLAEKEVCYAGPRLSVLHQTVELPDGRIIEGYIRLKSVTYVGVIALTPEGQLICERQYKHGPGKIILSLPAGGVDEGESTIAAAQRELLEETGYTSSQWKYIGKQTSLGNHCGPVGHIYIATDCIQTAEPDAGDLEEIKVELLTIPEVLNSILDGTWAVSGDLSALSLGLFKLGAININTDFLAQSSPYAAVTDNKD